jgi:hypothetical protein
MFRSLCAGLAGIAIMTTTHAAAAPELTLVENGQPRCVIILSASASLSEKRGARELQAHLRRISGAEVPIRDDRGALPERAILVGRSRHTDALRLKLDPALGPEGFRLVTAGGRLAILGSPVRGTMYGCSDLLERLGVRWFTPKVTRVPHDPTVRLPALDASATPAFEYREPFFTEAQERDWAARNRVNGAAADLDASTGGKITYQPFVHSFDELVPRSLFATHPEYFPLFRGKRTDGYVQRCLSNQEVLKLAIERVRHWIRETPEATLYSVSQNDTYNFCECDNCKAITEKYGANSGLYLWFVNQVAEAIEKEHPDKLIDTLAYQFTEAPPKDIVPRANVRVRLCPIDCCQAHPYERCSAPKTRAFLEHLRGWSRITSTLYIWHYNTNFANYLMPFPDFDEFPAEARLYRRSGVKGVFFQGDYAPGGGGSDAELRSWVMAKLLWNPDVDADALVTEWMQGVYGPAWRPMRAWFDLLHQKARDPKRHFTIYDPPTVHYLTPEVLAEGDRLFDEAGRLAAPDAAAAEYVTKSRLGLRYVKLMQKPTAGPELESFLKDVRRFGITQLFEGGSVDAWEKRYREKAR